MARKILSVQIVAIVTALFIAVFATKQAQPEVVSGDPVLFPGTDKDSVVDEDKVIVVDSEDSNKLKTVELATLLMQGTVINVLDKGVVGDGQITTGSITSGSSTLTIDEALFTVSDVGKSISIKLAGSAGCSEKPWLVTTIAGFTSSTVVTLSDSATATVSSEIVRFGTDNTTALASVESALASAGERTTVYFPAGHYVAPSYEIETTARNQTFVGVGDGTVLDGISFQLMHYNGKVQDMNLVGVNTYGVLFDDEDADGDSARRMGTVSHLYITDRNKAIAQLDTGSSCSIISCDLEQNDYGIYIDEDSTISIDRGDFKIIGCLMFSSFVDGIYITNAGVGELVGCKVHNSGEYGLHVAPDPEEQNDHVRNLHVTGCQFENTQDRSVEISSFADAGGGEVTVTTATAHYLTEKMEIDIEGTSNYDGTYEVVSVGSTTEFNITATYVAESGGSSKLVTLPGWDVYLTTGSGTYTSHQRINDVTFTGGDINYLRVDDGYAIEFANCQIKYQKWIGPSTCEKVYFFGMESGRTYEGGSVQKGDVPISGGATDSWGAFLGIDSKPWIKDGSFQLGFDTDRIKAIGEGTGTNPILSIYDSDETELFRFKENGQVLVDNSVYVKDIQGGTADYVLIYPSSVQVYRSSFYFDQRYIGGDYSWRTSNVSDRDTTPLTVHADGIVDINESAWDAGHLQLGSYHLWVDGSDDLRIKDGAPSSDTDGEVIGPVTDIYINLSGDTTGALTEDLNINEDTLVIEYDDDQVGIGTANPSELLHMYVSGDDVDVRLRIEGAGADSEVGLELYSNTAVDSARTQIYQKNDNFFIRNREEDGDIQVFYTNGATLVNGITLDASSDQLELMPTQGSVSVGKTNPSYTLDVEGDVSALQELYVRSDSNISAGEDAAILYLWSSDSDSSQAMASIRAEAPGAWGPMPADQDCNLDIYTTENGVSARRVRINDAGINVTGNVTATGTCCDYVFESDYDLMSLEEVESYIKEHGHLPGMTQGVGADDLAPLQIDLTKAIAELLVKVEEQALYILQLQSQINALKEKEHESH